MIRALFGGSFDPFHEGHLAVVETLRTRRLCDFIHVVPAWRSPFKTEVSASAEDRLAMTHLALAGRTDACVEDDEVRRHRPSFTIETLRGLHHRHPGAVWRLVMGADAYAELSRWREVAELFELATPLVFPRRGAVASPEVPGAILLADFDIPVDATEIRSQLAGGSLASVRVPPPVAAYIRDHGLYGFRKSPSEGGAACP